MCTVFIKNSSDTESDTNAVLDQIQLNLEVVGQHWSVFFRRMAKDFSNVQDIVVVFD